MSPTTNNSNYLQQINFFKITFILHIFIFYLRKYLLFLALRHCAVMNHAREIFSPLPRPLVYPSSVYYGHLYLPRTYRVFPINCFLF